MRAQGAACEVVTLAKHALILWEAEPSLHWALHLPLHVGHLPLCPELAQGVVQRLYRLFVLLHQRVQTGLDVRGLPATRATLSEFLQACFSTLCRCAGFCSIMP